MLLLLTVLSDILLAYLRTGRGQGSIENATQDGLAHAGKGNFDQAHAIFRA
jgi:hypothetical protein